MNDKDAHLMMEGLYKDISQKYGRGQAPVDAPQSGGEEDSWPGAAIRAEVEQYLSSQPEVQAGVLAIIDKYLGSGAPALTGAEKHKKYWSDFGQPKKNRDLF